MTNFENLKDASDSFNQLKAPDMFSLNSEISEVLFELYTIDTYIAGLVTCILENCSLSHEEVLNIPTCLFDDDGVSFIVENNSKQATNLSKFPEILNYAKALEKVRTILVSYLKDKYIWLNWGKYD